MQDLCVHRGTLRPGRVSRVGPRSLQLSAYGREKEPSLKQRDWSGWIANEVSLTLSYLILLPTVLKAVCNVWYFVLLLKPQLLLYHCSEKPFREFWITVMIWFSPRVTPKHKGPIVLPGYRSVVKERFSEWFIMFQACHTRGESLIKYITWRWSLFGTLPAQCKHAFR